MGGKRELGPMATEGLQRGGNRGVGGGGLPATVPLAVNLQERDILGLVELEGESRSFHLRERT